MSKGHTVQDSILREREGGERHDGREDVVVGDHDVAVCVCLCVRVSLCVRVGVFIWVCE